LDRLTSLLDSTLWAGYSQVQLLARMGLPCQRLGPVGAALDFRWSAIPEIKRCFLTSMAVSLTNVEVIGRHGRIIAPLSFVVAFGDLWVLLGPNGKTTLLNVLGARWKPTRGSTVILGRETGKFPIRDLWPMIPDVSHSIGEGLSPELTCIDVVLTGVHSTFVTRFQEFDDSEFRRAKSLLDKLGCLSLAERRFGECSLGERQGVLIARAQLTDPRLVLMDEPAAGFNPSARELLLEQLGLFGRQTAFVMATHHVQEIPPTAIHAGLMKDGELVEAGPIDEILRDDEMPRCFDLPLTVAKLPNGRWTAVGPGSAPRPHAAPTASCV
jgi:iron complex transport system ATP-binding protein